jgi:hypothetical protein
MKYLKYLFIIVLLFVEVAFATAQKTNYIWAFGDSSGIDFNNLSSPQPITTSMRSRGSCVSIADTNGNLLFYANTRASTAGGLTTKVYNKLHQEMANGNNVVGQGWYEELVILPVPDSANKYYLLTIDISGGTVSYGLYYSVIDMNLNGGLGDITLKNIRLNSTWWADCLGAIKHANGRDWWLFLKKIGNGADDNYYKYLVSPFGIDSMPPQQIGTGSTTGFIEFKWNKQGDRMAMVNSDGLIELYDFDRCSGMLSNPVTVRQQVTVSPIPSIWSCEFSASGNFLYISASPSQPDSNRLIQLDLRNYPTGIVQDTIYAVYSPQNTAGALKRGPDDKIYFSCAYTGPFNNYPYTATMYNSYNMNLGVINSPDSLGLACDFQPWSFYLNGKRTYWGLPNNPDYDMGPVVGSICDSLSTGFATITNTKGVINKVFPNPNNGAFYIELNQTFASPVWAELYDVQGKLCARQLIDNTHYTTPIRFEQVNASIYTLKLSTNKINLGTVKVVVTE